MKKDKLFILIILIAIFFRFFRLYDFQYWSVDEEIFVAVVRQIAVNHKLILTSPNVALGVSLGSFFHLLSAPVFILAGFTASRILIAGSILGVITTWAIYKTGEEVGGLAVARIAGFLYAASFLVAFSDRRWWPLSLDPLLSTLSIFSMVKIIKGELKYSLLLLISASFAWHADPSLAVIIVFIFLCMVVFKLPLIRKQYFPAIIWLLISITPFFIFELRHPGAISYPLMNFFTHARGQVGRFVDLVEILRGFTRSLFLTPGGTIEQYFAYIKNYPAPLFSPFAEILTAILLLLPLHNITREAKVVYLYLLAFLFGVIIFTLGLGSRFHQHYFVVVWPAFFILVALGLQKIPKILTLNFLALFLCANTATLLLATMRYPLFTKEQAVNRAIIKNPNQPFGLKIATADRYFEGIGGLFFLKNRFPINADYYAAWDWTYRAYSLYEITPVKGPVKNMITISPL